MSDKEICDLVVDAIEILLDKDEWLLVRDLNERSIAHKLAEYLQDLFIDFDVDCEYNGDIDSPNDKKKINILKEDLNHFGLLRSREEADECEYASRSVFPDIIVHKRGTNASNVCIIEIKKSTSQVSHEYDYIKLQSYTTGDVGNNLKYQMGIFVEFLTSNAVPDYQLKYFQNGNCVE